MRTLRLPGRRSTDAGHGRRRSLVTKLVNVRYLTGFTGSAGMLLVLPDELVLVTDGRYGQQAAEQLAAAGVERPHRGGRRRPARGGRARRSRAAGVARLALEADAVTWAQQRAFAETLVRRARAGGHRRAGRRPAPGQGRRARWPASRRPRRWPTQALANVRRRLADGLTEQEFGLELDFEIRRLGAWGNSFETIVGSGPTGPSPTTARRPGASSRATWWCSTSARWSTATART